MVITFFGHSTIHNSDSLTYQLKKAIIDAIKTDDNVTFYCGGYGDFDDLCARVCRSIKETHPHCEIVLVTPYITESQQRKMKELLERGIYDSTLYPPLEKVPYRFAISRRNERMADQADLIIAYVERTYGGANKSLEYARRKKKRIINLTK